MVTKMLFDEGVFVNPVVPPHVLERYVDSLLINGYTFQRTD